MSKHKPLGLKLRLGKKTRSNEAVPAWVIVRTRSKFRFNPKKRDWRHSDTEVD